jgi:hypothetical protein
VAVRSWPTWVVESETCVGSCVHLVGASISFEKNFYRLPFSPSSLVRHFGHSKVKESIRATSGEPSKYFSNKSIKL